MEIWIGRDGERHGPYKEADVREWLRSGQMSGADLGWYEGLADWQPLSVLLPDAIATATSGAGQPAAAAPAPLPQTTMAALDDYAGFWKRLGAYIIDYLVLIIPGKLIGTLFGSATAEAALKSAQENAAGNPAVVFAAIETYFQAIWPALALSTLFVWLYFALMESSVWQATVGKLAIGIRVTDIHGQRISLPRALGRYLAKFLSGLIFLIGFLMIAWTRRKQGLHDMLAETLVLNGRASQFDKAQSPSSGSFSA